VRAYGVVQLKDKTPITEMREVREGCVTGMLQSYCSARWIRSGYDLLFTKGDCPFHDAYPLAVLYRRSYVFAGLKFREQVSLAKIQTAAVKLKY